MEKKAFQDFYTDDVANCYGCGRLNEHGLQLKSYWEGDYSVARFQPKPYHTAVPGYVYGGLIASIIDCHGTGTAGAAYCRNKGIELTGEEPDLRFVTASLKVDYLKPTPIENEILLKGSVKELKGKKVIIEVELFSGKELTAKGTVITVKMPNTMKK